MPTSQMTNLDIFESDTLTSILSLLCTGEIEVIGQVTWSSNYTFLTQIEGDGGQIPAIYKPARGERPLWDFPGGSLAARETAAFHLSQALGWKFVPPTVLRDDGPAGPGSLQFYVDVDHDRHYFTMDEKEKEKLRPVVLFDILINNADRKGGHVLIDGQDQIWLIDHGVCFHSDYKLRTVIWDFIGEPIPDDLLTDLRTLSGQLAQDSALCSELRALIDDDELAALAQRTSDLLESGRFPGPGSGRPYPWPLV